MILRADNATLGDVLDKMDEPSLSRLIHDQEFAKLEEAVPTVTQVQTNGLQIAPSSGERSYGV